MAKILEARHLTVIYTIRKGLFSKAEVQALNDVDFDIEEKGSISVVGESGSGKTTLGRVLAGLQPPTRGTVLFYGKDIRTMSKEEFMKYRRSVQYIPQDPYSSFNPFKSIESALMDVVTFYKIADRRRAYSVISSMLKDLQLDPDEVLEKYPHQLSGGQLQRVAIARALLIRPKVIIADEIVSMLDASLRVDLIDLLKQVQREYGLGVVFITHDIALARYFAADGELVVMYRGRVVERGRTSEIIENPRDSYTKLLLSSHLEPSF